MQEIQGFMSSANIMFSLLVVFTLAVGHYVINRDLKKQKKFYKNKEKELKAREVLLNTSVRSVKETVQEYTVVFFETYMSPTIFTNETSDLTKEGEVNAKMEAAVYKTFLSISSNTPLQYRLSLIFGEDYYTEILLTLINKYMHDLVVMKGYNK